MMVNFYGEGLTTAEADGLLVGLSREDKRNARQANLENNCLDETPPAIYHLAFLEALWLSHNAIERLGAAHRLVNLRLLDLSENRLEELPPAIGTMALLEELYLMNNRLIRLPRELKRLEELRM